MPPGQIGSSRGTDALTVGIGATSASKQFNLLGLGVPPIPQLVWCFREEAKAFRKMSAQT